MIHQVGTASNSAALNLWLSENPWFSDPANNQERYDTVLRVNQELLDEGWDDTKISFYAEIDRRLEAEMARKASSQREAAVRLLQGQEPAAAEHRKRNLNEESSRLPRPKCNSFTY